MWSRLDYKRLVDGLVSTLRVLIMLAASIGMVNAGFLEPVTLGLWLFVLIVFSFVLFLTIVYNEPNWLRYLGLAFDAFLAILITGFVGSSHLWIGLLPVVTGALYWSFRGGVAAAAGMLIVQPGLLAWLGDPLLPPGEWIRIAAIYLATGLLMGWFGNRMTETLPGQNQNRGGRDRPRIGAGQEKRQKVYESISKVSASLNYLYVLESVQDAGSAALAVIDREAKNLVSAVFLLAQADPGESRFEIFSARKFTPADQRINLPAQQGLLAEVLENRRIEIISGIDRDPGLSQITALRACKSAAWVPLYTGSDTCGVLVFAHPDPEFFSAEKQEIISLLSIQTRIAIQNALLYQDLENENERIVTVQEQARKKLARDLHDGPTQSVAALAMRASIARRLLNHDTQAAGEELGKLEELARKTTKEIRHMLFTLRPLILESQGLVPALVTMAEKMYDTYRQKVVIEADPQAVACLDEAVQGVIFAIIEEAISNTRKHGQAEAIKVTVEALPMDLVLIEVVDNGVGFDLAAIEQDYETRSSLGLINMRERASLINARLEIEAAANKGVRVQLLVPANEKAAEYLHRAA